MAGSVVPERCPECDGVLARLRDDPPWCPACEWNLGQWPTPKLKYRRRAILRNRRGAFALNSRVLAEFTGTRPSRPRATRAGTILALTSGLLLLVDVAAVVGGAYLLATGIWTVKFLGVVLILIGIECRLRFGRIDGGVGTLPRAEYPKTWQVVELARQAVGAPRIDVLVVTNEFNASCGRAGLRRLTALEIGLPLWGALSPAGRMALLGHELGHLVNRDPTTSFLTQPALTTCGRLAQVFDPHDLVDSPNSVSQSLGGLVAYTVFYPLYTMFRGAHTALLRVAGEDHQRAEVYADGIGAALGGTDGAIELLDRLVSPRLVNGGLVRGATASQDPDVWRAAVAETTVLTAGQRRLAEQSSMRYEASRFSTHPPSGLRSRLARSWPAGAPALEIPADDLAAVDDELERWFKSARRAILNRSVF